MTTMDFSATLAALRRLRVETGSLVCFGCGHEHNCSTHGCAILRNAVEHMEAALSNYDSLSALVHRLETELKSEILSAAELRARLANEPLTLEELREMKGQPVWTVTTGLDGSGRWELVCDVDYEDVLEMVSCVDGFYAIEMDTYGSTWTAYRRPLERMKKIMRENGIMVIPSEYPGSTEKWNIQKPRDKKEEL